MSTEAGRITALIDGDISGLTSALNQAKSQATAAISGIEGDFKGKIGTGLSSSISGGDFTTAGKRIGGSLVDGISSSFGPLGGAVGEVATALGPAGIAATAAIAGAVVIGKAASDAAMQWEAGMSQISKTTGIDAGTDAFANLSSELKDLYSTMPTTMAEIQNVAKSAGSLGIDQANISGYTEVALQMGSAFDIPAENAAVAVGKVKSQLKSLPEGAENATDFARKFGSAVDYAGNAMNATEEEVLDFSTRTAGAFSNLGGSAYEVAGWGGSLASVFSSSELAAGSFNAALNQLMGTTKGSDMARAKAGELLGVTPEEFQELMANDPTDTLLRIGTAMEGLGTADRFQAAGILGGGYGDDFFQKMAGHTDEWRGQIADVVAEGEKGESIGNSFEAGAQNAKSGFQTLKNSVSAILTDIGGPINDVGSAIAGGLAENLNKVRTIGEELWGPFTAAISPATEAVGILAGGIGKLVGFQLDTLVAGAKGINTAFQTGKAFVSAFKEEISAVVTESATFKQISGYIDEAGAAFDRLSGWAGDTFDKIVDGLSNAIPTAIKGLGSAVGTLMDKAGLGGVADAASGLIGFGSDVYHNAAKKLGWETGEDIADGVKESDLPKAPGEALGSPEALAGAGDAGKEIAAAVFDPETWQLEANDAIITSMKAAGPGTKRADWKKDLGEIIGLTTSNGIEISSTIGGSSTKSYVILKTEGGAEFKKEYFTTGYTREQALHDLVMENKDALGLDEIGTMELEGLYDQADILKISGDVVIDNFLDVAANTQNEVQQAGQQIADAFAKGMVPDSAQISASLDSLRHLQLYDPEEAKAQGAENAIYYLDALADSIETYDEAKAKYLVEPDNKQALEDLERTRSNLQQKLSQNPLTVKVKAEWGQFDTKSLSELIYDPAALAAAAKNPELFFTGTIVPGIRSGMEAARDAIATGQITEDDVYNAFIKPLESVTEFLPSWLDNMNKMFKLGWIDADEYLRSLEGFLSSADKASAGMQKTAQATNIASVGYNNLEKAVADCEECLMSDFGAWQEAQDNLFNPSYIGQGGQAYLDWKNSVVSSVTAASAAVQAAGGMALGAGAQPQSVTAKLNLDTSAATAAMSAFETTAKTDIKKPLTIDSSAATSSITDIDNSAKTSVSKPLTIDTSQAMGAIASINAAASAPVYKTVYVTEVNTGGSGGSGAGAGSGGGGGGFGYSLPPIFMARGGYVSRPTLAVVGEAGPEYVIPAENMAKGLSRIGGGEVNITINSPIYGGGGQDIEALLAQRNKDLVAEITAQISEARRGL